MMMLRTLSRSVVQKTSSFSRMESRSLFIITDTDKLKEESELRKLRNRLSRMACADPHRRVSVLNVSTFI